MNFQNYLGVDLHKRRTYVVLMDKQGKVRDNRRLPNDEMEAYIKRLPSNTFAVVESTGNWSFMYDLLDAHLDQVVISQTGASHCCRSGEDRQDRCHHPGPSGPG